jgi:hypothetical protein
MGYTVGTVFECRTCHDPHGTSNNYALQEQVRSATGNMTVKGLAVYRIAPPSGTPTEPAGYDLRFFCNSCHLFDPATHDPLAGTSTVSFPNDCTRCHKHMNSTGTAGSRRL